jgi:predicted nucleic acid-binding protein
MFASSMSEDFLAVSIELAAGPHTRICTPRMSGSHHETAVTVFERYNDQALSFTDATTAALLERHAIDGVLSFDDDLDGVVKRFDPAEV